MSKYNCVWEKKKRFKTGEKALRIPTTDYQSEKILILGGSPGGNLVLGLISHINARSENVGMPGKIYAGSLETIQEVSILEKGLQEMTIIIGTWNSNWCTACSVTFEQWKH